MFDAAGCMFVVAVCMFVGHRLSDVGKLRHVQSISACVCVVCIVNVQACRQACARFDPYET